MDGVAILGDLIGIITGGITGMATGIGSGLNSFVTNLAFVTNGGTTELSAFANFVAVFAGIGLAVGLGRKVLSWLGSLGGRRV